MVRNRRKHSRRFKSCGLRRPELRRRLAFAKALEQLLLASTASAFLFCIAQTLPRDVYEFACSPNWLYAFDRILRYLSLAWFMAYFFVSAVNNQLSNRRRESRDLAFDVGQSLAVLVAAYGLGFVVEGRGFASEGDLRAFAMSHCVVMAICQFSLSYYWDERLVALHRIRACGLVVAFVGFMVATQLPYGAITLMLLIVIQLGLWRVWWCYFVLRRATEGDIDAIRSTYSVWVGTSLGSKPRRQLRVSRSERDASTVFQPWRCFRVLLLIVCWCIVWYLLAGGRYLCRC